MVYERAAGLRQIRILDLVRGGDHLVEFPEPVYTVRQHENPEFETTVLRFTYTSLVTPASVIDYDMAARTWTVRKQTEVLGGYDPARYRSERLFATAADGTPVPVSLVYQLPLERPGGPRPLLLNGYGAYGVSYDPAFSSSSLSLLDRGFVVAIAHIRGGEEMGRAWYEGGKLLNKPNTFGDFIAAAEHLIAEGYTSADRLTISGGSAGGLLMGAVANLRPDLFRAVLAEVPFVDVVNTMLDASLPLTVIEYDEWGNPNDAGVLPVHPLVLARTTTCGRRTIPTCWSPPGSTIPGWRTGSRPSSRRGSGPGRPTPTGCCSRPTWAPGTAARRGGGTSCGRWRSSTRSCWMCWGWRGRSLRESP